MRKSIRLSQNFLIDGPAVAMMIRLAGLTNNDTVLDIGAGSGVLTRHLAHHVNKVIAIEADPRLARSLRSDFASSSNVDVIQADFLTFNLPGAPYKVIANPPFNLTSAIVHKLVEANNPPQDCLLVLQLEAAEKFAGMHGAWSLFSILHSPKFAMSIEYRFDRQDFTPAPSVDAVLLRIRRRPDHLVAPNVYTTYADFVCYIYTHANPTILPALLQLFEPAKLAGLGPSFGSSLSARPTNLSPELWVRLYREFINAGSDRSRIVIRGAAQRHHLHASAIEKRHRTSLS